MMLLDPIGVPGIWFPFGLGVCTTNYICYELQLSGSVPVYA